jgi:hypothetical protein
MLKRVIANTPIRDVIVVSVRDVREMLPGAKTLKVCQLIQNLNLTTNQLLSGMPLRQSQPVSGQRTTSINGVKRFGMPELRRVNITTKLNIMNRDTDLIFEAYKKRPINESHDKDYVPSLEEIKTTLETEYKARIANYSSRGSELGYAVRDTQDRLANIDQEAVELKKIIDQEKEWTDKWNKEAVSTGRTPYTLWDALYSYVSDTSKEVNGFRLRTTFEKTPTIQMAELYKQYMSK